MVCPVVSRIFKFFLSPRTESSQHRINLLCVKIHVSFFLFALLTWIVGHSCWDAKGLLCLALSAMLEVLGLNIFQLAGPVSILFNSSTLKTPKLTFRSNLWPMLTNFWAVSRNYMQSSTLPNASWLTLHLSQGCSSTLIGKTFDIA